MKFDDLDVYGLFGLEFNADLLFDHKQKFIVNKDNQHKINVMDVS